MGIRRRRSSARTVATGIGTLGVVTAVGLAGTVAPAEAAAAADPHGHEPRTPITGAIPMRANADDRTYTVRSGDTVSAIAHRYGTTVAAIVSANDLNSRAQIQIGQQLRIPLGSEPTSGGSSSGSGSSSSSSGSSTSRYTVRSGDTLSGIASAHDTTVARLTALNHLASSVIYPGQQLTVSGGGSSGSGPNSSATSSGSTSSSTSSSSRYTVRSGDTVSGIAARHHVTVSAIIEANDLNSRALIRIGQVLRIPGGAGSGSSSSSASSASSPSSSGTTSSSASARSRYTVRSGDTLSGIAAAHDTTVAKLTTLNHLDSAVIYPGQVLRVPTTEQLVPSTFLHYTYPSSVVAAANENKAELLSMDLPSRSRMQEIIRTTAIQMGVDPALALAVAQQESGFDASAVSPANAVGVMQVIPSSGEWASDLVGRDLDLLDPHDNVVAGVAILRRLVASAPNLRTAIGGYYQGLSSVTNNGMYADTRRYVASVQTLMSRYQ